jgi:hypothetical protein
MRERNSHDDVTHSIIDITELTVNVTVGGIMNSKC